MELMLLARSRIAGIGVLLRLIQLGQLQCGTNELALGADITVTHYDNINVACR